tara:strand:+ start:286 stop:852 length:567 start_codon:yes stop_codon:yes gene_type:complete
MLYSLLLCAGMALAEPDPAILPPEPVTYPVEVTATDEAAPEPAPEPAPDPDTDPVGPKPPTQFQRLITGIGWIIGLVIGAPYNDEAFVIIVAGLLGEARLWIDRRKRGRVADVRDHPRKPRALGALAERELRAMADQHVDLRINELTNLQRTQIVQLKNALAEYLEAEQSAEGAAMAGQIPNHDGKEP